MTLGQILDKTALDMYQLEQCARLLHSGIMSIQDLLRAKLDANPEMESQFFVILSILDILEYLTLKHLSDAIQISKSQIAMMESLQASELSPCTHEQG
jgi:hypothetical protein